MIMILMMTTMMKNNKSKTIKGLNGVRHFENEKGNKLIKGWWEILFFTLKGYDKRFICK